MGPSNNARLDWKKVAIRAVELCANSSGGVPSTLFLLLKVGSILLWANLSASSSAIFLRQDRVISMSFIKRLGCIG